MAIYLDHNATSPMHPEVADAMMPFLQNPTGNPSSLHSYGRMARSAIESARAEDSLALNAIRVSFGMENSSGCRSVCSETFGIDEQAASRYAPGSRIKRY